MAEAYVSNSGTKAKKKKKKSEGNPFAGKEPTGGEQLKNAKKSPKMEKGASRMGAGAMTKGAQMKKPFASAARKKTKKR